MSEINKVVAHLLDGRRLKGTTADFLPNRATFHIQPPDGSPAAEVATRDLKSLFFVRDLVGNPAYKALRGFAGAAGATALGKKIAVHFKDGELLCGYALSYSADRGGFFMVPADTGSNNLRIFVAAAAASQIKVGPAAEALAQSMADEQAA